MSSTKLARRQFLQATSALGAGTALGFPSLLRAQTKQAIKIGIPTIMSGRLAQLGIATGNAAKMQSEAFNAAGGLNGRMLELVMRDSKGRPEESSRLTREMINGDKCDFILDCDASSGAFALQEVVRETGTLCMHATPEVSSLTADPKVRIPNSFRSARQGAQDSIVSGKYAADVAKEKGFTKWMTIGPDYGYGRDTTEQFVRYLKHFSPNQQVLGEQWPKMFQPDYTEFISRIQQQKPQALFTCLIGGDLVSFIDQGNLYGLFQDVELFAIALADFTTITQIKTMPRNVHSGTRYLSTFPATQENAAWANAYTAKFKDSPNNWSWQAATGVNFLTAAMKKTNSVDSKKMAEALRGMQIKSPFGAKGLLTLRASDQTLVDYAAGWGRITNKSPYIQGAKMGDWAVITELEAQWKKQMGWA
jgi:branched-chain amino acid transport system substrate-binding protein